MKTGHWVALGAAVLLAVLFGSRVLGGGQTGGFNQPPSQPLPDDDLARLTDPHPDHPRFCQPEQHHAGYVYTPHRYPQTIGGEISNAIHRGWSQMRIPRIDDVQWLIAPPSEAMF
ncbi:MAG TPA: hypothetical protein VEH31_12125 [Streptosporangiaceae bacterium]|nr:hypothetical protein [Streptosporangiaceae bacterium]